MKLMEPGLVDTHCHTEFSPDSKEKVEEYLRLTDGYVVTTEHLDFYDSKADDVLDYYTYTNKWDELNKLNDGRLLKGIEIGYTRQSLNQINKYLEDKKFDYKLLSVHQNGRYCFMNQSMKEKKPRDVVNEYMECLVDATEKFTNVDILAHIDYGFRVIEYDSFLLEEFKDKFEKVLRNIIKSNIALELNTRSMFDYGNLDVYKFILPIYKELGGNLYTLGSDAHVKGHYRYKFDQALEFLNEYR
ncbi:PHP domain-containing protein [Peptostreptococcus equinus]|uniref:Histidinol-phosphatase n=1 Tax=Peptostreptococcus equinus TaxID=3003601 RepID=A0ABY7JQU4_9FIRM|nr:PHP domain-containing protein [Peptostreptococcus sp. CBA3647]WAW15732.1 PHP domain-containing protein [Peptostreptococcus sp. CBA3647]